MQPILILDSFIEDEEIILNKRNGSLHDLNLDDNYDLSDDDDENYEVSKVFRNTY